MSELSVDRPQSAVTTGRRSARGNWHNRLRIGIMGGTGSSKTSLVSLISRLYDATEGSVRVGGEDVRRYDVESLRDAVSVVLQNNVLFSGTIYDNLRWGN